MPVHIHHTIAHQKGRQAFPQNYHVYGMVAGNNLKEARQTAGKT
jgi:hypothetical protein